MRHVMAQKSDEVRKQCGEKLKVCELPTCNMRIACLQYANG